MTLIESLAAVVVAAWLAHDEQALGAALIELAAASRGTFTLD